MELKGSKTEKNLWAAFAGESQARNKYDYYASQAKKDGYEQIAEYFSESALNEKEHAKRFFKILMGGSIPKTMENLVDAAEGEHYEHSQMYPEFERIAREEGFEEIANIFRAIATVEMYHEKRYLKLYQNIKQDKVFKRPTAIKWKCRNCGYVYEGPEAPKVCPACDHPQAYYEEWCENY